MYITKGLTVAMVPTGTMGSEIFRKAARRLDCLSMQTNAKMKRALLAYGVTALYVDMIAEVLLKDSEKARQFIKNGQKGLSLEDNLTNLFPDRKMIFIRHDAGPACFMTDTDNILYARDFELKMAREEDAARSGQWPKINNLAQSEQHFSAGGAGQDLLARAITGSFSPAHLQQQFHSGDKPVDQIIELINRPKPRPVR